MEKCLFVVFVIMYEKIDLEGFKLLNVLDGYWLEIYFILVSVWMW